jgi:hypothetical protein
MAARKVLTNVHAGPTLGKSSRHKAVCTVENNIKQLFLKNEKLILPTPSRHTANKVLYQTIEEHIAINIYENQINFYDALRILGLFLRMLLESVKQSCINVENVRGTAKSLLQNLKQFQTNLAKFHHKRPKQLRKMRVIPEEIYMLVPQGEVEFKHYALFLMKLLKIRGDQSNRNQKITNQIKQVFRLIEYQCNKSGEDNQKIGFQPDIKIKPQIRRLRRTFFVFGHGSQNGSIGAERPDCTVRCSGLLKHINNLFSNAKLRFRPEIILTQCYGHLSLEGNYPNITIDAVSSADVPLTLVYKSRNLSLMLYVVRSWHQKYYSLFQKQDFSYQNSTHCRLDA